MPLIDCKNLKKLKQFQGPLSYFLDLESELLEKVKIYNNEIKEELEVKMLEKILSIKTLKEVQFKLYHLEDNVIKKIKGENESILVLTIILEIQNDEYNFLYLLDKFPNLTDIFIYSLSFFGNESINLEIKENPKCKINKITILCSTQHNAKIKLFCQSYEKLYSLCIFYSYTIENYKNVLPIFNAGNKIIFNTLYFLNIESNSSSEIDFDILENLYDNIENIPNLKVLRLNCNFKNINEEFYHKFINKILKLQLTYIYICVDWTNNNQNIEYTFDELKSICKDINKYYYFKNIHIMKLN